MTRSNVRNKDLKWQSTENFKKAKSLCNVLLEKAKMQPFQKFASKETMTKKEFWNTVKLHSTIEIAREDAPISLEIKNKTVIEEQKLVQEFDSFYRNIVQNTSGKIQN